MSRRNTANAAAAAGPSLSSTVPSTVAMGPPPSRDVVMGPPPVPPQVNQQNPNDNQQDIADKYSKLKKRFLELEARYKESAVELQRSGERNVKMRQERNILLDRIIELEAMQANTPGSHRLPLPLNSAFPRAFVSSRAKNFFVANLRQAVHELDTEDPDNRLDPLQTSRHVGPMARKRQEREREEEEKRAREGREEDGRKNKRLRAQPKRDVREVGHGGHVGGAHGHVQSGNGNGTPPVLVSSTGTRLRLKPPAPPPPPPQSDPHPSHAPSPSPHLQNQMMQPPHPHRDHSQTSHHQGSHRQNPNQNMIQHNQHHHQTQPHPSHPNANPYSQPPSQLHHSASYSHSHSRRESRSRSPGSPPRHEDARSHSRHHSYSQRPPSPPPQQSYFHPGPNPSLPPPNLPPHPNNNGHPSPPIPMNSPRTDRPSKPKRLKAHTVTSKVYNIPTVPRDKKFRPLLPLNVGIMTVINLGEVCMREHFHTERYIFPVGYEVTRRYLSTVDPNSEVVYNCSILDGGDGPKFKLVPSDAPEHAVISGTATGAWAQIVRQANSIRNRQHSNSVSGPDYFGLAQNTIKHLIQELNGADMLRDYVWQDFVEGGPLGGRHAAVIPALPDEYDTQAGFPQEHYYPPEFEREMHFHERERERERERGDRMDYEGEQEAMVSGPSGSVRPSPSLNIQHEHPQQGQARERGRRRSSRSSVNMDTGNANGRGEEYVVRSPAHASGHSNGNAGMTSRSPVLHREQQYALAPPPPTGPRPRPHSHSQSPVSAQSPYIAQGAGASAASSVSYHSMSTSPPPPVPATFASIMNAYPTSAPTASRRRSRSPGSESEYGHGN